MLRLNTPHLFSNKTIGTDDLRIGTDQKIKQPTRSFLICFFKPFKTLIEFPEIKNKAGQWSWALLTFLSFRLSLVEFC
jgi:hypothetical protein